MDIKKFILSSILVFSILGIFSLASAPHVEAGETVNAGFVNGIWYSSNDFFAGDNVRIYSAIQNNSGFDIVGKIQFFDNQEIVGDAEFSVVDGRLIEKWTDWRAKGGDRNIYIKLIDTKKAIIGGGFEPITLAFDSSRVDKRFVDTDTDGDKIGNVVDTDDDNDGLSDEEEKMLGTNPLVYNGAEEKLDGTPESGSGKTALKDIADSVGQKTNDTIDNIVGTLKNKKKAIDESARQDESSSRANYYAKLLLALIYILEHKWLLVVFSFVLAIIIGKILGII